MRQLLLLLFIFFVVCFLFFFFREISGHKISKFICMKNDDNKEYLAMSSAAVVVGILRLKCFLLNFFFFFVTQHAK